MTRSSWKGIVLNEDSSRNHIVMPSDIGKVSLIHNGKSLYQLTLSKYMLYKKLGTLAYTKKLCFFRSKKGKKKKK